MKAKAHRSSGCSSLPSSKIVSVHLADAGAMCFLQSVVGQESTKRDHDFVKVCVHHESKQWMIHKSRRNTVPAETICSKFPCKFGFTALTTVQPGCFRERHHMAA